MLTILHKFACMKYIIFAVKIGHISSSVPYVENNISAANTSNYSCTPSVGNSPFLHIFHNIIGYISTQFLHFEILPVIIMKCDLYYIFPKRKF